MAEWSTEKEEEWYEGILHEDKEISLAALRDWHRPRASGFFIDGSGKRWHVRSELPSGGPQAIRATLIYCHGMNNHVNGKHTGEFFAKLAASGFAVFAPDMAGHGYSEGKRGMVEDWSDIFEALQRFVEMLFGKTEHPTEPGTFDAGVPLDVLRAVRSVPLFLSGMSMGGMIAVYLALYLQEYSRVKLEGVALISPAISVPMPPQTVQMVLRNLVVPLFKNCEMPTVLSSSSKPKHSWSFDLNDPRQRQIAEFDIRDCAFRFPDVGLGWGKAMLWGTAGAFSEVFSVINEDLELAEFPFLILHDPTDRVTSFAGSEQMMQIAPSKDKTLVRMDGARHAIIYTNQDKAVAQIASWILARAQSHITASSKLP
mmetsp:Transcript_30573/g.59986  ORF Transcript_30573/g.59986 Transcript_30573/m.59986 type:complete len:370 (-) Transcript_30573:255-1364(-)